MYTTYNTIVKTCLEPIVPVALTVLFSATPKIAGSKVWAKINAEVAKSVFLGSPMFVH